MREDVISLLGSSWTGYQQLVRECLHSDIDLLEKLNGRLLDNAGKQLRPMTALLVSKALGCAGNESICFAAATEMLHNATLFHDDVADNSSLRRGKPTLTAIAGPTAAVLVGDFWLSRAVTLVVSMPHQSEAVVYFSKTLSDLAEGEMLQMQKAGDADTTEEDYLRIVYCKTASLFETACRIAAISAGASGEQVNAAATFGAALGIAFQIKDDIMDYQNSEIGKPVGIDLREQKITLPLLGAMEQVSPDERLAIRQKVKRISDEPALCDELHDFVLTHGGIEYATRKLSERIEEAIAALDAFPACTERDILAQLAHYNAIRTR